MPQVVTNLLQRQSLRKKMCGTCVAKAMRATMTDGSIKCGFRGKVNAIPGGT